VDCVEAKDLVQLYTDQELDLLRVVDVDKHLQSCADCRALYHQQHMLRSALRRDAGYHRATPELRERLRFALHAEKNGAKRPLGRWPKWWNAGLAVAAAVVLSVSVALYIVLPTSQDRLENDIVSSHVRSLMANHLSDVASSDQHAVKPWFNGRLDYSPPVNDLTAQGFPLVGGRLDYVDNRPVAALVYRHRQHTINLFVWPSTDAHEQKPRALSRQGYNLLRWTQRGMEFWAVSDLNEAELRQFVDNVSPLTEPRQG